MEQLAIVIPAYRSRFLTQTLISLAEQKDKRFNVYIGNDAGDIEIDGIVSEIGQDLSLEYRRFKSNIGSKSLVSQWHRCIEMSGGEPWIWLLPDDDMVSEDCVSSFYNHLSGHSSTYDLLRFRSSHIDSEGKVTTQCTVPPEIESGIDQVLEKLVHNRSSTVAEYIFSRKRFEHHHGFPDFELAWGSDDALWFKLSYPNGIYTLTSGHVYLRQSGDNISGNRPSLSRGKLKGLYQFLSWLKIQEEFRQKMDEPEAKQKFTAYSKFYVFDFLRNYNIAFSIRSLLALANRNKNLWNDGYLLNLYRLIRFYARNKYAG